MLWKVYSGATMFLGHNVLWEMESSVERRIVVA